MSKPTMIIEWYTAQNDADWERMCVPPLPDCAPAAAPAVHGRLSSRHFLSSVAVVLLLALASYWWYSVQPELQQDEAGPRATVEQALQAVAPSDSSLAVRFPDDQATLYWQYHFAQVEGGLQASLPTPAPTAHGDGTLPTFEVQGDQNVTRVVLYPDHGTPAYRQTRLYHRIAADWRQTAPDAALWGPERRLEMPSFVFRFRQNDAAAVIAAAPQVEALFTTLQQNFGLPTTFGAEKLVIEVSVTQPPGQASSWSVVPDHIIVASPAVYLAPIELTGKELLAQAIALPLLEYVLAQTSEQYQLDSGWQPLLNGLYLWQVWELDLPLAAWREDVVQWLYLDVPSTRSGQPFVLPDHYRELCATHKLWISSPLQLNIPLFCTELDRENWFFDVWRPHDPLIRLAQLAMPVRPDEYVESSSRNADHHSGQTVALATLIEYAVATYGRERLPVLVASLGQYERWDTLLPAVFGVSAAEFEEGWQAYLTAHYAIPLPLSPYHN